MPDNPTPTEKRRRGLFPRYSINRVMEIPDAIYAIGHGERVLRIEVLDRLQRQPDSGTTRKMITAAGKSGYELISGSYNAQFLELTERGSQIVTASIEYERLKLIYDSLFSNEIFSAFVSYFNGKPLPIDSIALDYFRRQHKLDSNDAKTCWSVVKENLIDQKLTESFSGKPHVISRERALDNIKKSPVFNGAETDPDFNDGSSPLTTAEYEDQPEKDAVKSAITLPTPRNSLYPQFHFNIQIHLPEGGSPEQYEAIFRSIGKHLLGHNEGNE